MDVIIKAPASATKKRVKKRKSKLSTSDSKIAVIETIQLQLPISKPVTTAERPKAKKRKCKTDKETLGDISEKYPILKDEELVKRFMKVPFTNNQKGRIRQAVKDSLQGTSNAIVPDIVHSKIQSILKSSPDLTDSQLRRVRILYNLLKTSLKGENIVDETSKESPDKLAKAAKKKILDTSNGDKKDVKVESMSKTKRDQLVKKVKGPKRYVVFLGNLPLDIDNEKILNHFSEMNEHVKDIRIPKVKDGKKSAIAYVELTNEASYEFALSKHHSMLGSKRINVLYTTQKNGKISKAHAKSKSAKLIALQKSGKLVGSIPLAKKRSQRRLKMKQARAKENA